MTEQELYQIVRREIDVRASIDPAFRQAQRSIDNGNGDFTDSAQCSRFLSKFLGEQLAKHILELPPDEGRSELCQQLLKDFFDELSQRFERVQSRLDRQNGVGLATVEPDFPAERVQNVAGSLNDTTVSDETIQSRCRNAVSNVANSMHDDFIWTNAEFRRKAGFFVEITRTTGAKACKWCQDVSGTFIGDYNNKALRQVFRRHDNCSCVITYYYKRYSASKNIVETTRVTLSGTTTTWEGQEQYEISELSKYQPTRYTLEQAEAIERKGLAKLGFIKEGEKIVYNKVKAEEYLEGLTTGENGGRIKSIDVDDFELRTYGKKINPEVSKMIIDTMNQCEKNGGFIISEISTSVVSTSTHGTPVLQIEMLSNGLLQLNINAEYLAGKTLEEVNKAFENTDSIVANSLLEAVIHESGHAISIKGKNTQEVEELYRKLKDKGIAGISAIALQDGAECLAELEVLRYRGIEVSQEASEFYKKYMGREYK